MLVSDFSAAYRHYPGVKQRCWVHLLRDIDELDACCCRMAVRDSEYQERLGWQR